MKKIRAIDILDIALSLLLIATAIVFAMRHPDNGVVQWLSNHWMPKL